MFISRHTLKWTKTCRSSGDFPHAHTAHFLLNRHRRRAIRRRTCRDVGATAPHEGETTPAPGNLADRDFTAKSPNEKRPADITRDIKAGDGKGVPLAAGRLP